MKPGTLAVILITLIQPAVHAQTVNVCLQGTKDLRPAVLHTAKLTAENIFDDIGVSLHWTHCVPDPREAIEVKLSWNTPRTLSPGVLAYAFPYGSRGGQIRVFADRVQRQAPLFEGALLGHVLAHEIGHVLEQIVRHSSEGLMKGRWTRRDHDEMTLRLLKFAPHDVQLIQMGLAHRRELALRAQSQSAQYSTATPHAAHE
jgi:hypothetical protein